MYLCFEFCTFKILFQNTLQIVKDDFFDFESDNEASGMDDPTHNAASRPAFFCCQQC